MDLGPYVNPYSVTTSLTGLCYVALIFLCLRHPSRREPAYQVFIVYLLTMALWQAAYFMVSVSETAETALFWYRVVVPAVSGQFIIYFMFIKALLHMGSSSTAAWGGLLLWACVAALSAALDPTAIFSGIRRDGVTSLFVPTIGPMLYVIAAPSYLFLAYTAWRLARAHKNRPGLQRRRIQYLLLGIVVVAVGTAANFVPRLQPYPIDVIANLINAAIIAYVVLRYQLLDIRFVIRRGLAYSIPTAIIGVSYFFLSSLAVAWFHLVVGYQLLLSLLVAAITAAVAQPLRDRVQAWVDRHFFRETYDSSLMLQRLSHTAASVLDLDRLAGMILDEVTTVMHVEKAAFFVKHEDGGEFRLMARRGPGQGAEVTLRREHPLVEWLSTRDQIVTRDDLGSRPEFRALWGQERHDLEELDAELFIPLKTEGGLVGVFALGPKLSEEAYTQDDQLTLETVANQTALAVEKARLYATEQRRLRESLILLDIVTAVGSTLNLRQVLKLIARRTAEACGVHRCSIFLLDEQRQRVLPLMSQFASGATSEQLWERFRHETYVQTIDKVPAIRQVLEDRQPLVLGPDTIAFVPAAWVTPFDIHSLLVIPLVSRDRAIGAMALDCVEPGQCFGQEQINLAMTIGGQVAAAIESARLYERALEEKAKTEAILRETFGGIVVVDDRWRVVSMNPGAALITGIAADDAQGKRIADVFGAEIAGPDSPLVRARHSGERVPPEELALSARGGTKHVLLGATPLQIADQAPSGFLLSFADISKLKEIDRLRSSILANVSHELRTPLASIKAYTELLLAGADETDAVLRQEWLAVIDQETDRLTGLITDILSLSRLESGHIGLMKEPLNVGEVITGIVRLFEVQARRRDMVLTLQSQPDLPPLLADRGLMESIVRNLLDNAIKFGHEGGHVRVAVWDGGDNLMFSVEDDGIGIPEDAIPHLFAKFFRVPSTDVAAVQGTGLGLALVKEAVAAHGGRIEVRSTLGEGSCFTVALPQTHPPAAADTEASAAVLQSTA